MSIVPTINPLDNSVRVIPRQTCGRTRYHWVHRRHAGSEGYSDESFASEFGALLAAVDIARCAGARIHATDTQRLALINYWQARGEQLFILGYGRDLCANQYERQGYDAVCDELNLFLDEVLFKPDLGDDDLGVFILDGETAMALEWEAA